MPVQTKSLIGSPAVQKEKSGNAIGHSKTLTARPLVARTLDKKSLKKKK